MFCYTSTQLKTRKNCEEVVCFTPGDTQICRGFKEHNLNTCESNVYAVVSRVAPETKLGQVCFDNQRNVRFLSTADHAKSELLVSTRTKTCLQGQIFRETVVLPQIRTLKEEQRKKKCFPWDKVVDQFQKALKM